MLIHAFSLSASHFVSCTVPCIGIECHLWWLMQLVWYRNLGLIGWLEVGKSLGGASAELPDHPLVTAPSVRETPTMTSSSASEAGCCLRKVLFGKNERQHDRKSSAHSMKAITLSFEAEFGLDAERRLQLAYHLEGFKLLHACNCDASVRPLTERVTKAIRGKSFRPGSTRSGRSLCQPVEKEPELSCLKRVDPTKEDDLTEVKEEETQISEAAASSPSAESEETFPKSQGGCKTKTPPDSFIF